jgi:hypothetical protein
MRRLSRRQLLWTALFAVAIGLLVLLVAFIGLGYLRLPTSAGPSVTVSSVHWVIEQGTNAQNQTWFGKSQFNYSGASWIAPTYAAGTTFDVSWTVVNYDNVTRNICDVTIATPFLLVKTSPTLPFAAVVGDESGSLKIFVTTSSSASGSFMLNITVDALSCNSGG